MFLTQSLAYAGRNSLSKHGLRFAAVEAVRHPPQGGIPNPGSVEQSTSQHHSHAKLVGVSSPPVSVLASLEVRKYDH